MTYLNDGRYKLVYTGEVPLHYKDLTGKKIDIPTDQGIKQVIVNDMKVDAKSGKVTFDITVAKNPIPLIIVGYALLGGSLLGLAGFALSEVNETLDTMLPYVLIGAVIFLYINLRKK